MGATTVADYERVLDGHGPILQALEDDRTLHHQSKAALRELVLRLDRNNKRWHQAWRGQFGEGTTERAALASVTTKRRRNPAVPGQTVIVAVETFGDGVRLKFDAPRGKEFEVRHRGPGATEFQVLAAGLTARIFAHRSLAVGAHRYQVISRNALGPGAASPPWTVNVGEPQAA